MTQFLPLNGPVTAAASEPGFLRLTMIEIRKMVDTRASRWILAGLFATAGLVVAGTAALNASEGEPMGFAESARGLGLFASLAMPAIGILGITSDLAHRTTYVFYPLVRSRSALFWAKITAAALVAIALQLFCFLAAAAVTVALAGAAMNGSMFDGAVFHGAGSAVLQSTTMCLLSTLFGVGIASLLGRPMLSIIVVVLMTLLGNGLLIGLLPDAAGYLSTITVLGLFAGGQDAPSLPEVLSSLALWYVLPLLAGWLLAINRDA